MNEMASVDAHAVCVSQCGCAQFLFPLLYVCEYSCVFIYALAEESSALRSLCPCESESSFEVLMPNGYGNNVDVPSREIWCPGQLTPSLWS